jgi:hypothetical protein
MKFIFSCLLLLLLFPNISQAVGVAVEPSSLEFIYNANQSETLLISNISQEPIVITVQADDLADNINIQPSEFTLLPDQVSPVDLEFYFTDQQSGIKKTNISIISKALHKKSFNAASGIKIPVTIAIVIDRWQWNAATIFLVVFSTLLLLGLVAQIIFILWRPRKKHSFLSIDFVWHHKKGNNLFKKIFKK